MLQKEIESLLKTYIDPLLGVDLISAKALKQISITENQVLIEIVLGFPHSNVMNTLTEGLTALLQPILSDKSLFININSSIDTHLGRPELKAIPGIKNIIAVGSGKGGVGKSTISVNMALALAKEGAKVGLLDADIYGPSQPSMLGSLKAKPVIKDKTFEPVICHGIQTMSIGYLVEETGALVWRGPMIGKALQQLLYDTVWDALDYLIVDLPPGTGDIQLTLCQKAPITGAVIVTTPQDLALSDVRRAAEMFQKLKVPILGIVENMSHYECPACGHIDAIFGEGGALKLAQEFKVPLWDKIPLDPYIREMTDHGKPSVLDGERNEAKLFKQLARKAAALISLQPKDYSLKFPKVVVQHEGVA